MSEPVVGATFELLAQKREKRYSGFFTHKIHFATSGPDPILAMKLTVITSEDATEDDYWAWWDSETDSVRHVWPREFLVEMCFPYGSKAESERGRGRVIRVRVEER